MQILSRFFVIACLVTLCAAPKAQAAETPAPPLPVRELQPDEVFPEALAVIFSGRERMRFEASWSGGIKIGEIEVRIMPYHGGDSYAIAAKVKSAGPLETFYPVDDDFLCIVSGAMKLPTEYFVRQKEGHGRKVTRRQTAYNQEAKVVKYRKNDDPERLYSMSGRSYNEFAAFIISRALTFAADAVVPTFADDRRHEVSVKLRNREKRRSMFGERDTLKVEPIMNFKGLYEKSGSTVLWLTDDRCRAPVEIKSRIAVGALVAKLVEYENPACPELGGGKEPAPSGPDTEAEERTVEATENTEQ